jgi:hypothetical protein
MVQLAKVAGDNVKEGEVAADFRIGRMVDGKVEEDE